MAETFNKKALRQKKDKRKQDKIAKKEERKLNNNKGKSFDEMIMYVDENGNVTNIPPDKQHRIKIKAEEIQLGATRIPEQREFTGMVTLYMADKGYGFITEDETRNTVFLHSNKLEEMIKEKDRVSYEKERTPKGYAALNIRKIK